MKEYRVIAVDGPAGSGKSTIAGKLAEQIGFVHADSGAIYRTITLALMKKFGAGNSIEDFQKTVQNVKEEDLKTLAVDIGFESQKQVNRIAGKDAGEEIRSPDVTGRIKFIADTLFCREEVNRLLRKFATYTDIVVDGRDIGSIVFPETPYKFFLDASIEVRAGRRKKDFIDQGRDISIQEISEDIRKRDEEDRNRPVGALICPKDAILIDTSSMTPENVLGSLMSHMQIHF